MTLWHSSDAAVATGGVNTADWAATGVSIDTRSIAAGDLFVALTDQRDGHDFVAAAFANGAAAAMVTHRPDNVAPDAPLLIVSDVLAALRDLARGARARTAARVIGVTGSVGKTSTKDMLNVVLGAHGRVHVAERSFNNHWGVPLTLARMPIDTEFAVLEIGMNASGEIAPLAKLAQLDVAVITTIAPVHLAAFETVADIAREKATIFDGLKDGGVGVINADTAYNDILRDGLNPRDIRSFGCLSGCDYRLIDCVISDQHQTISIDANGRDAVFELASIGAHFAQNALGVVAVSDALNLPLKTSLDAIKNWHVPNGRGQRQIIEWPMGSFTLLDDAYNANPTSVQAALSVLANTPITGTGRRIAILGDMLELGTAEADFHRALAHYDAIEKIDKIHTLGRLMAHLYAALPAHKRGIMAQTPDDMIDRLDEIIMPNDVVMIKGSLGAQAHRIVTAIKAQDLQQKGE